MSQPVFYLLDRNAVIMIENFFKGYFSDGDEHWKKCKIVFDKIDKKINTISAMLAIIEGKAPINNLNIERQISACNEASVLKRYFKFANTDADAIIRLSDRFSILSMGSHEYGFNSYINFYKTISNFLSNVISPEERIKVEDKVIFLATMYNIPKVHPLVIGALSVLHGNATARKVLKFKTGAKSNPYGSVTDIMQIYRIEHLKLFLKAGRYANHKIKFLSFDESLSTFIKWFQVKRITDRPFNNSRIVEINFTPNMKELFPGMSEERIEELTDKIK